MLFFQAMLLLGYVYAWLLVRLPTRAQIAIHLTLLAASCLAMPIAPWKSVAAVGDPPAAIAILLLSAIGLPYFLLASTSPLVQACRDHPTPHRRVYRFFAVSTLPSLPSPRLSASAIHPP